MTENTERSREELEAELASLRARQTAVENVAPELSTRDRSPVKPQDHRPADTEVHKLNFYGVPVEVEQRMLKDWRLQRMIGRSQKGDMSAPSEILDFLIGEDNHEAIIDAIVEQDGWCDSEKIGEVTKELFEKVAAGNS